MSRRTTTQSARALSLPWGSALLAIVAVTVLLAACASTESVSFDPDRPDRGAGTDAVAVAVGQIVVHSDEVIGPFDHRLVGTNVPAWLGPDLAGNQDFRDLLRASGTSVLRFPGGSWSSSYDWLACEQRDGDRCNWTWAMRPSDFVDLMESTGVTGMWTVSFNGTAEEAAAAVAFFNGDLADETPIGTDRNGRDWQTVGHWARLRAAGGHPEPAGIKYWEVGNEVYGAVSSAGDQCASWGWEDVWTCDGAEYVSGNGDHDGYLRFHDAMVAVDPTIEVGAVGVGDQGGWSDWDDEVVEGAGAKIGFYVVHQYGSDGSVPADEVLELPSAAWPQIMGDVQKAFRDHGETEPPVAVTEHNLVSFIDGDDKALMPTMLNAFYLAETTGEMATHGVRIANQWNFANGRAPNGSDYGLIDAESLRRSPAYYALALWARSGNELVRTDLGDDLDDLVVFGTRTADGAVRLLVLNPSSKAVRADIPAPTTGATTAVTSLAVTADSLESTEVMVNGSDDPGRDLDQDVETLEPAADGVLNHEFPPTSLTLLRWGA